jgi:hypothetical protein
MSVSEVVDFMIENRNVVWDNKKQELLSDTTFNDYKGRMKTFFKDLGITDNLTGGLYRLIK